MKNKGLLIVISVLVVIVIVICVVLGINKKDTKEITNITVNTQSKENYKEIKRFECNQFTEANLSQVDLASGYLKNFVNDVIYDQKAAYNSLKKEYKEKRFNNSYDKFVEYIQYIGEEWLSIELDKYLVTNDGKRFVCIDNYGTQYIFDIVRGVMDYEVTIDTYTLTENEFNKQFEEVKEQKKIVMIVDKIINMINNKDYDKLYDKLDTGFKQEQFSNKADYIKYLQNEFYKHNEETYVKYTKEGDVHVYQIEVKDITGEYSTIRPITVMVKLLDNNDFVYTIPFNF